MPPLEQSGATVASKQRKKWTTPVGPVPPPPPSVAVSTTWPPIGTSCGLTCVKNVFGTGAIALPCSDRSRLPVLVDAWPACVICNTRMWKEAPLAEPTNVSPCPQSSEDATWPPQEMATVSPSASKLRSICRSTVPVVETVIDEGCT